MVKLKNKRGISQTKTLLQVKTNPQTKNPCLLVKNKQRKRTEYSSPRPCWEIKDSSNFLKQCDAQAKWTSQKNLTRNERPPITQQRSLKYDCIKATVTFSFRFVLSWLAPALLGQEPLPLPSYCAKKRKKRGATTDKHRKEEWKRHTQESLRDRKLFLTKPLSQGEYTSPNLILPALQLAPHKKEERRIKSRQLFPRSHGVETKIGKDLRRPTTELSRWTQRSTKKKAQEQGCQTGSQGSRGSHCSLKCACMQAVAKAQQAEAETSRKRHRHRLHAQSHSSKQGTHNLLLSNHEEWLCLWLTCISNLASVSHPCSTAPLGSLPYCSLLHDRPIMTNSIAFNKTWLKGPDFDIPPCLQWQKWWNQVSNIAKTGI